MAVPIRWHDLAQVRWGEHSMVEALRAALRDPLNQCMTWRVTGRRCAGGSTAWWRRCGRCCARRCATR